jgi:hypothetical protein
MSSSWRATLDLTADTLDWGVDLTIPRRLLHLVRDPLNLNLELLPSAPLLGQGPLQSRPLAGILGLLPKSALLGHPSRVAKPPSPLQIQDQGQPARAAVSEQQQPGTREFHTLAAVGHPAPGHTLGDLTPFPAKVRWAEFGRATHLRLAVLTVTAVITIQTAWSCNTWFRL